MSIHCSEPGIIDYFLATTIWDEDLSTIPNERMGIEDGNLDHPLDKFLEDRMLEVALRTTVEPVTDPAWCEEVGAFETLPADWNPSQEAGHRAYRGKNH
jgi:hypothetical protein